MGWIAWTKEEDDIIHESYQGTSWDDLLLILPGRTCNAIKARALQLGVNRIPPKEEKVKLSKRRAGGVSGNYGIIALSDGSQVIVDKDDYDWLIFFTWHKSESSVIRLAQVCKQCEKQTTRNVTHMAIVIKL